MASVSGGGNIKVVVRVRPFNGRELDRKAKCIVSMKDDQTVLTPSADPRSKSNKAVSDTVKTFAFDKSYWSFNKDDPTYAGQEAVFADLGMPLLDNAFQGYNNCIFAYGQTGSGKSYSMMGYGAEEGVIPKICRVMFDRIAAIQQDPNMKCTVEVSYIEIYNERVRDLLNPSSKSNLRVREHPSTGPYVEDLAKLVVQSFPEIENLMDEGNKARTVAATNMNETSSRSHAVFTLTLTQKRHDVDTNMDTEKVAKISLVDLAGSERATSSGATGARLKEGAEINRSLSTLGRVIAALADLSTGKKKNASLVPYRDSVLTWLLKDSLGGNSLTAMIAAISPADINFEETLSTLRYADSAKRIKNHAVVNEDPNARMIRELKEELAQLRSKMKSGVPAEGGAAEEQYPADTPLDKQFVSITQADGTVKRVSKADIAEQLDQSEKLYKDLNQTWEEKLQNTELVHKEREAALEELGISIEKGFVGMSTPKRMPHLVNLSDDPLLAECLVYNLKPGKTTVGNVDTAQNADIRLNGSKILHDHCTFDNDDGVVTVVPKDHAAIMVNGQRVEQPKRLRSGYRIILGDFHIFRFNHPQEARAERAEEGSRLKHAVNIEDVDSPSLRPSHARAHSGTSIDGSDADGDRTLFNASPIPYRGNDRESDWDMARKEAISAVMGPGHKMSALTDDELDSLFEDLQRVRAVRKGGNRLFEAHMDDDTDSNHSFPVRDKYLSNDTLDGFSLDTALTVPSTPQHHGEDERLVTVRNELQEHLEKQKEEYQAKLESAQASNTEMEQIRAEKAQMEESLKAMKEEMTKQLQVQREEHDRQLAKLREKTEERPRHPSGLTERQINIVVKAYELWRQRRFVAMATAVLQNAATLKEAQIMSQQMDKNVVFQFAIADEGHAYGSTYDLVLNDITSDDDDESLVSCRKPTAAVRVIDFRHEVAHLWSLDKLHTRVRMMRQMHQYLDRPEYIKHFRLDNPFSEPCLPEYTRIGDADIPLSAVFECKVQDFALDVYSPFTFTVIGIVRLSLEPSSAEAPSSTLKFNVVMQEFVGFPEREGTQVHAQLFFPGISAEDGATTTQMVSDFEDGPIRFDSVHSMSVSMDASPESCLRISFFGKATSMHLDKLLSWDDMRDTPNQPNQKRKRARLGEHEFYNEEHHDCFARVQIQEISEDGSYQPVEVVQQNALDNGAFQLHQGLQRRIVIEVTSTAGASIPWTGVSGARIGKLHLLDGGGKVTDMNNQQVEVPLSMAETPVIRTNRDYTTNMKLISYWDSGAHGSLLLDRPTAEPLRVRMTLTWDMQSVKLAQPLPMSLELSVQMRSRSYIRQQSLLSQIWSSERVVHSTTGVFTLTARPSASNKVGDLWRFSTQESYVKGEEGLTGWGPRGVSLIRDFLDMNRKRRRAAAVEHTKRILGPSEMDYEVSTSKQEEVSLTEEQKTELARYIHLWKSNKDISARILSQSNTDVPSQNAPSTPSLNGESSSGVSTPPTLLLANARLVPKSAELLKSGHLLTPDAGQTTWVRRYVELRVPYLHIHATNTGDQVNAINLTNSRIDHAPQLAKLLQSKRDSARLSVFALYGTTKAWLFATTRESERSEWIFAIDRTYFSEGGAGRSGTATPESEEDWDEYRAR